MQNIDNLYPSLLIGYCKDWEAFHKWDFGFFETRYGSQSFRLNRTLAKHKSRFFTLQEFIRYLFNTNEKDPYYLTSFITNRHLNKEDFEYVKNLEVFHNLFLYLPEEIRPNFSWLYMGCKGTGSLLHEDVMMTSAWNALLKGKKIWVFIKNYGEEAIQNSIDFFVSVPERLEELKSNANYIVLEQNEGDIVYTPSGWVHMVYNLEATISITENFLDEYNIDKVIGYCLANNWDDWAKVIQAIKVKFIL